MKTTIDSLLGGSMIHEHEAGTIACKHCGTRGAHHCPDDLCGPDEEEIAASRFVDVITCACGTCAIYATGTAPSTFECANCGSRMDTPHQDGAVRPMNLLAVSA